MTFHDIIIAKAVELDQIERELLLPSSPSSSSSSSSKTFTGSTTGPTTPVDTHDIMPEDRVFDYQLETDKPNGSDRPKSFTGSTRGPTTPVDTRDIMPEDQVFDYHLETDKRPFEGSTTGPTTKVDKNDIMPEDRVFDYHLETDKPDSAESKSNDTTTLAARRTTVPQEVPGRARLGSGPPVAIIRGGAKGEGEKGGDDANHHQVALISISHDGDYATATCVGFDAGSMVKGGLGWMVSR